MELVKRSYYSGKRLRNLQNFQRKLYVKLRKFEYKEKLSAEASGRAQAGQLRTDLFNLDLGLYGMLLSTVTTEDEIKKKMTDMSYDLDVIHDDLLQASYDFNDLLINKYNELTEKK
jgi:hypothetical protein